MVQITRKNLCSTQGGLEFFKRYKDSFGNVKIAELAGTILKLTNYEDEIMEISGCFTGGYIGEGPRGTHEVLSLCGFDISEEYISRNDTFVLEK